VEEFSKYEYNAEGETDELAITMKTKYITHPPQR